ncbi:hypothetical protein ACIBCT_20880 [Streptosporangium sp. NPDC050855]|uniref:hypothetical protein n=1 Tax=Streptosporangium sp. NPDC050855 TaxID=3366194 RepID=UPI0037ADF52D
MARIRSLKPEAFQSETLAEVSLEAERTFYGLTTQADDRGRHPDKPAVINGALWAVRSEQKLHTAADLDNELAELQQVGAICRYVGCDGKRYLHFVTWDDHQKVDKAGKSRLPRCPLADHWREKDECSIHGSEECPPSASPPRNLSEPSRDSREPSIPAESHQSGHGEDLTSGSPREPSTNTPEGSAKAPEKFETQPDQQKGKSSRDSREDSRDPREPSTLDLGPRTLDLGSFPSGSTAPPRRDSAKPINAGTVIAAYMEGAKAAGQPAPAETLRNRVGKQARALLGDKNTDHEALLIAARNMGAGGWQDLATQLQRDAAAKKPKDSRDSRFAANSGARSHTPTAEELADMEIEV